MHNKKAKKWISLILAIAFFFNTCCPVYAREGNPGDRAEWALAGLGFFSGLVTGIGMIISPWSGFASSIASDAMGLYMYYYQYQEYGKPLFKIGDITITKGAFYSMVAGVVGGAIGGFAGGAASGGGAANGLSSAGTTVARVTVGSIVKAIIDGIINFFKGLIMGVVNLVKSIFRAIWNLIKDLQKAFATFVREASQNFLKAVGTLIGNIAKAIYNFIRNKQVQN